MSIGCVVGEGSRSAWCDISTRTPYVDGRLGDFSLLRSCARSNPWSRSSSSPDSVFSSSSLGGSVRVLSKSLGRCIPSGVSSSEVPRALEDRLVAVEGMVRGGRFLGGDCHGNTENSRSQEQCNP
jgi:hypothetical protein